MFFLFLLFNFSYILLGYMVGASNLVWARIYYCLFSNISFVSLVFLYLKGLMVNYVTFLMYRYFSIIDQCLKNCNNKFQPIPNCSPIPCNQAVKYKEYSLKWYITLLNSSINNNDKGEIFLIFINKEVGTMKKTEREILILAKNMHPTAN